MKRFLIITDIAVTLLLGACLCFVACNKDEIAPPTNNEQLTTSNETTGSSRAAGKHLEVINNQLYLDGERFKIVEANSPESRLRECSFAELDQLNACGINTIYATLYGGDVTSIHPFINRSNPAAGFNDAVVNNWVAYLERWIYGYPGQRHIVHLLLSEKENHFTLSETNHKAMIAYFANKFRNFEGYIIYNREELPTGKSAYINTYYRYLKQVAPYSIRGIHNNTAENPWSSHYTSADTLIQFLAFQEWHGNFDRRIRAEVARGKWAGYASEVTGGFQTHPSCSTLTATLSNAGGTYSSGMGFFISSKDHSAPTFHSSYCGCYQYAAALAGTGTGNPPPPPPAAFTVRYSASNTRTPATQLAEGATIGLANKYFFVPTNEGVAPVKFTLKKNGATVVPQRTENSAPFDMIGGNSTTATAYNFTGGNYQIIVSNGTGATATINFVVQ